jgi:uncharacterized membrane protein
MLSELWHLLSHLDSKTRLGCSIMVAMLVFLLLPNTTHLDLRILTSWISGAICFLGLVVMMMCHATPQKTRYRAQQQEAQHLAVFLVVVVTACTSIFAIGLMQANNQDTVTLPSNLEAALSFLAVVCSWFLTHTMFALHYATCYYRPDFSNSETGYTGGLGFPGDSEPDYWDFMYYAFTLGMTAQTSDVSVPSGFLRQLTIGHGIVSFFFYMVILASSVNIASSLI